jgi:hypothetical protein
MGVAVINAAEFETVKESMLTPPTPSQQLTWTLTAQDTSRISNKVDSVSNVYIVELRGRWR